VPARNSRCSLAVSTLSVFWRWALGGRGMVPVGLNDPPPFLPRRGRSTWPDARDRAVLLGRG
jgi:hypothetical protein